MITIHNNENVKIIENGEVKSTVELRGLSTDEKPSKIGNKLTDASLDNILQMCINATSYTETKTLAELGLSNYRASVSRVEALPHYQDFLNAGWTIGYEA